MFVIIELIFSGYLRELKIFILEFNLYLIKKNFFVATSEENGEKTKKSNNPNDLNLNKQLKLFSMLFFNVNLRLFRIFLASI